jgi:transcriptional regulator with GAF, ATPase, and Fis domain
MPALIVKRPGQSAETIALVKSLTSLGKGDDHDIVLSDPTAGESVVAIENVNGIFNASSVEGAGFGVNGKKVARHRLSDGDVMRIGQTEISFHLTAPRAISQTPTPAPGGELVQLHDLYRFSDRLLASGDIERLIEALIDEVIRVTRADKGFLVLVENSELNVKVARNLDRQNIANALERLSDSVVNRVLQTKKPLIVSDALHDADFKASESVVNLKLCSVMCVPLLERGGGPAFGLIYLGNDRIANHFEQRSLELLTIYAAQASLLIRNALLLSELTLENRALKTAQEESRFGDIIGSSENMREVFRKLEKIAPTDIPVLITGETGTGKELIARELHRRSPRRGGPFVTINCGAIPENLLESELFGHVKGAFTGAVATRIGKFQAANAGTLFLDEVGELPVSLQVKLLRALQDKIITKVGDNRGESVDIRVIAATNRVVEEEIKKGTFREDLYYRLNVVGLHLPPLRERGDDIEVIARHLLTRYAKEFSSTAKAFAPSGLQAMRRYAWPGNIRQLENRIKKAVVLAEGPLVTAEDLDLRSENLDPIQTLAQAVEEYKERYIDEVLRRNGENRTKTARDLGVDARTVFRYLERKRARLEGRAPVDMPEDESSGGPLEQG